MVLIIDISLIYIRKMPIKLHGKVIQEFRKGSEPGKVRRKNKMKANGEEKTEYFRQEQSKKDRVKVEYVCVCMHM